MMYVDEDENQRRLHNEDEDHEVNSGNGSTCAAYTEFLHTDTGNVNFVVVSHAFIMIVCCWMLIPKGAFHPRGYHKSLQITGTIGVWIGLLVLFANDHSQANSVHTVFGWILVIFLIFQASAGISIKWMSLSSRFRVVHKYLGKPLAIALAFNGVLGLHLGMGTDLKPTPHSNRQNESYGHGGPVVFYVLYSYILFKADLVRFPLHFLRTEAKLMIVGGVLSAFVDSVILTSPQQVLTKMGHSQQTHLSIAILMIAAGSLSIRFANQRYTRGLAPALCFFIYGISMMHHLQETEMSTMLHRAHALGFIFASVCRYLDDTKSMALFVLISAGLFLFSQEAFVDFAICLNIMPLPWIALIISLILSLMAVHAYVDNKAGAVDGSIDRNAYRQVNVSEQPTTSIGKSNDSGNKEADGQLEMSPILSNI